MDDADLDALSDDELQTRLEQRRVPHAMAVLLVADRDRCDVVREEILGWLRD